MNEWPGGFYVFVIRGLGFKLSCLAGQFYLIEVVNASIKEKVQHSAAPFSDYRNSLVNSSETSCY